MRRRTRQKHFKSLTVGRKGGGWGVRKPKLGAWLTNNWMGRGGGCSGGRYWGRYSGEWVELWPGDRREGHGAGGS